MQRPPLQNKSIGETSAQGSGGPKPMELGMVRRRTLTREKIQKLRAENACFYCRKPNARHVARDCPQKKKARGKWDGSLVLTVGANEAEKEDGEQKSAVQRDSVQVGQLLTEAAAVENQKKEPVDTGV